jgi:hypothetical protein
MRIIRMLGIVAIVMFAIVPLTAGTVGEINSGVSVPIEMHTPEPAIAATATSPMLTEVERQLYLDQMNNPGPRAQLQKNGFVCFRSEAGEPDIVVRRNTSNEYDFEISPHDAFCI